MCNVAKLKKNLCWRPKDTIFFRKVTTPIDPAKDTSQAASTGIASRNSPIYTCAVKLRVFAAIATTDNFLGLFGELQRVKGSKSRFEISLILITRNAHHDLSFLAGYVV